MIVSVIIPTYRRPQLLKACLRELLNQRFDTAEYEIIVVSDGPDRATEEAVKEMSNGEAPLLRYLPMPYKKGPAAARNHGWKNAAGNIIAFTDDDCLPDVNWLAEIVKNCDQKSNIAITGRVIVPIDEYPTDYERNTANLEKADFITANCACTKAALILAGGFDEQFSMAWREDSDLHFKLMLNDIQIKKANTAVITHPVRQCKWGVSIKEQKKTMYDALLYKKYPKLFRKKIRPTSPLLYYAIILAFATMIIGWAIHQSGLSLAGLLVWGTLTVYLTFKRLKSASLAASHIAEMLVTSIVIPFTSVYWQWYGAVKYKVLFI